jgi:cytoskeletal protein CcmA (bactofilin family)
MFSKVPKQARIDTLIGKAARLQGDLEYAGGLHLDGQILGNVTAVSGTNSSLSVSETARIEGAVEVPHVMLNGVVRGDIYARERLILGANARVEGNVSYGVIEMTLGAQIMGKLTQYPPEGAAEAAPAPAEATESG